MKILEQRRKVAKGKKWNLWIVKNKKEYADKIEERLKATQGADIWVETKWRNLKSCIVDLADYVLKENKQEQRVQRNWKIT